MHELVPVVAVAEHEHRRAVGDELEQHRHHAEPAVAENGAGPDDRDVEPGRDRVVTQQLGPQLGPPVRLERAAAASLGDGVVLRDTEHRARRRVHDLGDARVACGDQHVRGAADVDRVEQRAVLGERHLGDVVEHDVDAVARGAHGGAIAHVARDEVGARERSDPAGSGRRSAPRRRGRAPARRARCRSSRCRR